MALFCFQEPLPQIPVRHRLIAVVEPSVLPPLLVPTPPHAVDEVGGVGVDSHRMPLVYHLQGDTSSCYLHPQVGGILLATADLLALALPKDNDSVASGTTGSSGCPVGVGVDFRFRQGRRHSCSSPPRSLLYTLTRLGPQQTNDQVQPLDLAPCVLLVESSFRSVVL